MSTQQAIGRLLLASLAVCFSLDFHFAVAEEKKNSPCDGEPVFPGEEGVTPPQRSVFVPPETTEATRHLDGSVTLQYVVTCKGNVEKIEVVKSGGLDFDRAAIKAISQWKYKPAIRDGAPVTVYLMAVVQFDGLDPPLFRKRDKAAPKPTFIGSSDPKTPPDVFNDQSTECWTGPAKVVSTEASPNVRYWHNKCSEHGKALGFLICVTPINLDKWSCGIVFGLPFGTRVPDNVTQDGSRVDRDDSIIYFPDFGAFHYDWGEPLGYKVGACEVADVTECHNDAVEDQAQADGWCRPADKPSRCLSAIKWLKDRVNETGEDPAAIWKKEGGSRRAYQ